MFDELVSRVEHIPPKILRSILTDVIWEGDGTSAGAALTFDDGPDPEVTPRVLDQLDGAGVKGTFFLRGDRAAAYPALAREIAQRGHLIGNHSHTHQRLFLMDARDIAREIDEATRAIGDATGRTPRWFRPPYGWFGRTCAQLIREREMAMTLWTVLAGDYGEDSPDAILHRTAPFLRPGAVIVFHDTREGGGDALPGIIHDVTELGRARGTGFCRVDELAIGHEMEIADDDCS